MLKKSIPLLTLLAMGTALVTLQAPATAEPGLEMHQKKEIDNNYWWPNRLNLEPLRKNDAKSNPLGDFNYAEAFASLDLDALKADLKKTMRTSQDWWPADYNHYGPFFIRMAWHSAGTYRTFDGRGGSDGGMQRFAPLNSWPDNTNLDKAQRLLWPIKQKYGRNISWGDLMVLAGTVAMEDMGFKIFGFAGGRVDTWEPDEVNWGPEGEWLGRDGRHEADGKLKKPFGAARMGLIYVNPEGPNRVPDPLLAAKEIRDTFGNMAMNDEETAALIAGGHTFGKAHGAAAGSNLGAEPEGASLEEQGLGWKNKHGSGKGADTITSGLEGAWTAAPTQWTHMYLENLWNNEWEQTESPAGAIQWEPKGDDTAGTVPDAHREGVYHKPIIFTTDLALRYDPAYAKITKRWLEHPEEFDKAFAKAWFKLTHRDLGPRSHYLGNMVPNEEMVWQDPIPAANHPLVNDADVAKLKGQILSSGVSGSALVKAAWAAASTYRNTDYRGGANGGRLRLDPQMNWAVNDPAELKKTLAALEKVRGSFNSSAGGGKMISMADMIVLGGAAAIEAAAKKAGHTITVPFKPGRADASKAQTDVHSFQFLKPSADAFRNYYETGNSRNPAEMMVETSAKLGLSVPEMTVLIGGMRALNANSGMSKHGILTDRPGTLSNDFFVNLLGMDTDWKKSSNTAGIYEGYQHGTNKKKYTATPVDLIFGSNSELRAVAEVYAFEGSEMTFIHDFIQAWTKVMNADRM